MLIFLWIGLPHCIFDHMSQLTSYKRWLWYFLFFFQKTLSSSSCRATSTDIPDPLSPLLPIVHRFWLVLRATSRILTELLYVGSSWSPCFCSAMWGGPLEYITYEFVPASPAVSCMCDSSNFDSFGDGWKVSVQLLLWGVLPPGLVQNCT